MIFGNATQDNKGLEDSKMAPVINRKNISRVLQTPQSTREQI